MKLLVKLRGYREGRKATKLLRSRAQKDIHLARINSEAAVRATVTRFSPDVTPFLRWSLFPQNHQMHVSV